MSAFESIKTLEGMKERASALTPFTDLELKSMVTSYANLMPATGLEDLSPSLDALSALMKREAHVSHKEWARTLIASESLAHVVGEPDDPAFREAFHRVLLGGGWDRAVEAVGMRQGKPWAVLITGLNGIRKTTCTYQPWFQSVLAEALQCPPDSPMPPQGDLPCGDNAFFRQLDFIVSTLANEQFRELFSTYDLSQVDGYAAAKDGIFARYRKAAEMVGLLLIQAARKRRLNVMTETSGRDVAMYDYIDFAFPSEEYRKLVIHFKINDVAFAEKSVATRMVSEMKTGQAALSALRATDASDAAAVLRSTRALVAANMGGPYGPEVLKAIKAESDTVWKDVVSTGRPGWHMASIEIEASADTDWRVRAAKGGSEYVFVAPPASL